MQKSLLDPVLNQAANIPGLRHVSQDEFYKAVFASKLNLHPHFDRVPYPFSSTWKCLNSGVIFGRSVGRYENGECGNTTTDYYLVEPAP